MVVVQNSAEGAKRKLIVRPANAALLSTEAWRVLHVGMPLPEEVYWTYLTGENFDPLVDIACLARAAHDHLVVHGTYLHVELHGDAKMEAVVATRQGLHPQTALKLHTVVANKSHTAARRTSAPCVVPSTAQAVKRRPLLLELHRPPLTHLLPMLSVHTHTASVAVQGPPPVECWPWLPAGAWQNSVYSGAMLLVTLVSIMNFCIETLPRYEHLRDSRTSIFFWIESFCIALFTLDYGWRFGWSRHKTRFVTSTLNVVDLLAIIPYFITLFVASNASSLGIIRVLRFGRVGTLLKIGRHSENLQGAAVSIKRVSGELILFTILLIFCAFPIAAAIFYLGMEQNTFTSIPEAMWWAVITVTTVGYGDIAPTQVSGQFIGALAAVGATLLLCIPTGILISGKL